MLRDIEPGVFVLLIDADANNGVDEPVDQERRHAGKDRGKEASDRLIEELRSLTPMGMLQPITPTRPRNTVTRQERICFIAFGAVVILLAFYVLLRSR